MAIRDRQTAMNCAREEGELKGKIEGEAKGKLEGEVEGEIKIIRMLQGLLNMPASQEEELQRLGLEQLRGPHARPARKFRNR